MKLKYITSIVLNGLFFCLLFLSQYSIGQEKEVLEEIISSSQVELQLFLERIPQGMEPNYGFQNREEFNKVTLLYPTNVFFPSDNYYNNEQMDTNRVNFQPSKYWNIPVSLEGEICCFLQGMFIENNFKINSIGGNLIAKKLSLFDENYLDIDLPNRCLMLFPDIKKQFLIYYKEELSYNNSKCFILDDSFQSSQFFEQNLTEVLNQCKGFSNQQNLRKNEN